MNHRPIRILFLIHDLGQGGAEKVLVNLVNHLDRRRFEVSLVSLFGGGVNESFLSPDIRCRSVFPPAIPGNSHLMKLFSPRLLHRLCVRGQYDIEVSYLEGPSARVISGCEDAGTRLVSWIHVEQKNRRRASAAFRSEAEAAACYARFDRIVAVSRAVKDDFAALFPGASPAEVLYNTNDSSAIRRLAAEEATDDPGGFWLVGVGKLIKTKGFDRLLRVVKRLRDEGFDLRLRLLGEGAEEAALRRLANELGIAPYVCFLGYRVNPYPVIAHSDLFVCASHAEGFSTAATEALILGTPVCTVEVAGMRELLGDGAYGLLTDNSEQALYEGLHRLLTEPELLARYRQKAAERGEQFSTEHSVRAVEDFFLALAGEGSAL